ASDRHSRKRDRLIRRLICRLRPSGTATVDRVSAIAHFLRFLRSAAMNFLAAALPFTSLAARFVLRLPELARLVVRAALFFFERRGALELLDRIEFPSDARASVFWTAALCCADPHGPLGSTGIIVPLHGPRSEAHTVSPADLGLVNRPLRRIRSWFGLG